MKRSTINHIMAEADAMIRRHGFVLPPFATWSPEMFRARNDADRIVTARMAEKLMRLCFLIERRYAPYSKWFGAAFSRLTTSRATISKLRILRSGFRNRGSTRGLCRRIAGRCGIHHE